MLVSWEVVEGESLSEPILHPNELLDNRFVWYEPSC
jgi:hypothetical protein